MAKAQSFEEWLYEMEGFAFRVERACDDVGAETTTQAIRLKKWLQTAWELGKAEALDGKA